MNQIKLKIKNVSTKLQDDAKRLIENHFYDYLFVNERIFYSEEDQKDYLYLDATLKVNISRKPIFAVKYCLNNDDVVGNCTICDDIHKCPHVISLIHMFNNNLLSNITTDKNEVDEILDIQKRRVYLKKYEREKNYRKEKIKQLTSKMGQVDTLNTLEEIQLVPILDITDESEYSEYSCLLSLKIGTSKLYSVGSIKDFIILVKNKEIHKYGKNLTICHEINNFDDTSKKLIKILFSMLNILLTYDLPSAYFKTIKIDRDLTEEILELYKNKEIIIKNSNEAHSVVNILDDYEIKAKVENDVLSLSEENSQDMILIHGGTCDYVVHDGIMSRLKVKEEMRPLIEFIVNNGDFSIKDIEKDFYKNIYARLCDDIEVDDAFKDKLNIKSFDVELFFDYPDEEITVKKKLYVNGELTEEDALSDDLLIINKLSKINSVLNNIGFVNNQITDEMKIANFLYLDLSSLNKIARIYLSEKLKSLQVRKMSRIQSNLGYDVDMLSICFDNLNYSNEELYRIMQAIKKKTKFVRLNKNTILELDEKFAMELQNMVEEFNLNEKKLAEKQLMPLYQSLKLIGGTTELTKIEMDDKLKSILEEIAHYKDANYQIPEIFNGIMRSYQIDAFKWMKTLIKYNFSGILADDMGLGKTLEVISVIASDEKSMPSIIVCPKSLAYNWKNEFIKWGLDEIATVISGNASEREYIIKRIDSNEKKIYITSYDSLRNDLILYKKKKFRFNILDEAQYIKNNQTLKAKSVKELSSELRFVLTGTPIENSIVDLWSIFDFLMPNYLSNYTNFKRKYEREVNSSQNSELTHLLVKKITPFILRRTKNEVLHDLPEKIETIQYAQMLDEQRKVYESQVLKTREMLLEDSSKIQILAALTRLRQLCVDPSLFVEGYTSGSAKVELAMEIIKDCIATNHKILVFSQFTSIFDILIDIFRVEKIDYYMITGKTNASERVELATKFNHPQNKVSVFLISLKAGGTGLNLVGADTVLHLDPWWNISAENQATDRAHRIGQKNIVRVIKLVCENSIEQKVIELQERKKQVIDNVIANNDENITKLSSLDLQFLLS